jgi:hypothetical protein
LFAACWRRRHEWVDERLAAFEQQCREQARQEPEAHAQGYGEKADTMGKEIPKSERSF